MKSILTLFGTFIFSIFVENFVRIVIIFYKQEELFFYGIQSMPGPGWVVALFISVFLGTWLSGMLITTIIPININRNLSLLFFLTVLWRLSEFSQLGDSQLPYTLGMILTQLVSIILVYFSTSRIISVESINKRR